MPMWGRDRNPARMTPPRMVQPNKELVSRLLIRQDEAGILLETELREPIPQVTDRV